MASAPFAIIHPEPEVAKQITQWVGQAGYTAQVILDCNTGTALFEEGQVGLIIADDNGSIYRMLKTKRLSIPVILLAGQPTVDKAVEAIKMGAADYLSFPPEKNLLLSAVAKAMALQKQESEEARINKKDAQHHFITKSTRMRQLLEVAERVASSSATVLIEGESGTGKELLARHIHMCSDRSNKSFVAMNCAALPESLAESELFGYDKGAFTGASKTRPGKFEQAHQGTLLLDEISEMPLALQAKLLRVLQEKEVDHLGGGKPIKVNVRCIATCNQNLSQMVQAGTFRQDLYYRLRVIPLRIPPLRDRKDDIPHLLEYFLKKYHMDKREKSPRFDDTCMAYLQQWHWPGNVRELENTVQRAVLINQGPTIIKSSLLLDKEMGVTENTTTDSLVGMTVKDLEKKLIGQTLSHLNQNRTHAAKMLGISIRTLRNKLREYQEKNNAPNESIQGNESLAR